VISEQRYSHMFVQVCSVRSKPKSEVVFGSAEVKL